MGVFKTIPVPTGPSTFRCRKTSRFSPVQITRPRYRNGREDFSKLKINRKNGANMKRILATNFLLIVVLASALSAKNTASSGVDSKQTMVANVAKTDPPIPCPGSDEPPERR
jgi:hypothetical protein